MSRQKIHLNNIPTTGIPYLNQKKFELEIVEKWLDPLR
jgi:hypothetical protein